MEPFKKEEMTTMVSCVNKLQSEGYTENFVADEKGLFAPSVKKKYKPSHVKINSFYRFEGISDPADNSIVYAIETHDGIKGLVVDAFGPYANEHVAKFMEEVEEISKGVHVDDE
jgi:hypothetical protein